MYRVDDVNPAMIRWARECKGYTQAQVARRSGLAKLPAWEAGTLAPTPRQLNRLARVLDVAERHLSDDKPPEQPLPIPDFRAFEGERAPRLSPDLRKTIHVCQLRQEWYHDYALEHEHPVALVRSASLCDHPATVAATIAERLGFDLAGRGASPADAMQSLIQAADRTGVLVMVNRVVVNNNHRKLSTEEFRGFALADPWAPLIFVNAAASKTEQMYTLAHELARLAAGLTALSNSEPELRPNARSEDVWCNAVALELLVPLSALRSALDGAHSASAALEHLAGTFRVSPKLILQRLRDASRQERQEPLDGGERDGHVPHIRTWLDRGAFDAAAAEYNGCDDPAGTTSGGNFYDTTIARVGRRFAFALIGHTDEGRTLFRDAFRMLGVRDGDIFAKLARTVGIRP